MCKLAIFGGLAPRQSNTKTYSCMVQYTKLCYEMKLYKLPLNSYVKTEVVSEPDCERPLYAKSK